MKTLMCRCGCNREAVYLCTGFEFDPYVKGGKGKPYIDEPACSNAAEYLASTSFELGLPYSDKKVRVTTTREVVKG